MKPEGPTSRGRAGGVSGMAAGPAGSVFPAEQDGPVPEGAAGYPNARRADKRLARREIRARSRVPGRHEPGDPPTPDADIAWLAACGVHADLTSRVQGHGEILDMRGTNLETAPARPGCCSGAAGHSTGGTAWNHDAS
jgi:hypothetical protein